ncbi:MAG: sigma-70 family RNA polymerase sigma factor [Bacteroidia bacterium]|nr:sigma-70 family RNA polymerase sigma factor [Bacteroidia bacterium]
MNTKEEFLILLEQSRNIIYKICYVYSTDLHPQEDLFQEVVINLWNSWPRFRHDCKAQTWVYRISLNTCISYLRKSKSRPDYLPLTQNIEVVAEEFDLARTRELYNLINKLDKIEKALVLLYIEEKSHEEISQIIGIPRTNVAVKLFRIKEKLKQMSQNQN